VAKLIILRGNSDSGESLARKIWFRVIMPFSFYDEYDYVSIDTTDLTADRVVEKEGFRLRTFGLGYLLL